MESNNLISKNIKDKLIGIGLTETQINEKVLEISKQYKDLIGEGWEKPTKQKIAIYFNSMLNSSDKLYSVIYLGGEKAFDNNNKMRTWASNNLGKKRPVSGKALKAKGAKEYIVKENEYAWGWNQGLVIPVAADWQKKIFVLIEIKKELILKSITIKGENATNDFNINPGNKIKIWLSPEKVEQGSWLDTTKKIIDSGALSQEKLNQLLEGPLSNLKIDLEELNNFQTKEDIKKELYIFKADVAEIKDNSFGGYTVVVSSPNDPSILINLNVDEIDFSDLALGLTIFANVYMGKERPVYKVYNIITPEIYKKEVVKKTTKEEIITEDVVEETVEEEQISESDLGLDEAEDIL